MTLILGPNNATFSIELQEVKGMDADDVSPQPTWPPTSPQRSWFVQVEVHPGGQRFPGLMDGFRKARLLEGGPPVCPP